MLFIPRKGQQRCDNCLSIGGRRISAIPRPCQYCATAFTPADRNHNSIYCSRECKDKLRAQLISDKRSTAKQARNDSKDSKFTAVHYKSCKVCKRASYFKSLKEKYCRACAIKYGNGGCLRIIKGIGVRQCVVCSIKFSGMPGNLTKTCSDECRLEAVRRTKRASKSARRAKIRGAEREVFDPLEVLARDNWQCQACGIDTPRILRGTCESNAPELDHIIPLSKAGSHTRANTQCLCRACNHDKSDRVEPLAA